jgi:hypothetical protein
LFAAGLLAASACDPPPTVDVPAADLVAKATVIDTESSPSDGKIPIVIQFFSADVFVELAGSTAISCNGVAMPWNGLGYAARIPLVAAGGTYDCRHVRSGVTASMLIIVPARPAILSPGAGASVARSASLAVTYVPGGGSGVRISAGDPSTGLGGNLEPDDGSGTVDVSSLKAGPGSIGIVRESTFTPGGSGFQSASVAYSSGSRITVTWT